MGMFDLVGRHLLYDFLLGNRGIGVPSDGGEGVPHIGAHEIRRGHAAADLVIPADAGLCPGVSLERRAQIPLKRPHIVPLDAQPTGIHDADQLLGLGIARPRRREQLLHRLRVFLRIHQVARGLDLSPGRARKTEGKGKTKAFHGILLGLALGAVSAQASELPRQLQASDFPDFPPEQVKLGQLLFFDPILSGNRNISCATCHSPDHASADGLPLGIGEGGHGVGPKRTAGVGEDRIEKRIPRNAPALWNLGAKDIHTMFHDGRLHVSDLYGNGFNSPAQEWLPDGLDSVLAAQALFPMTSEFEMAGNPKENQVAGAVYDRIDNVWPILAKRVRVIPEYAEMFAAAYPEIESPLDINIVHIANAIGAFEATEFQSFDSPFDAFLAGDEDALSAEQKAGMALFYGEAGCAVCHSGPLFTDQDFHAITLPHFGPGRTRQWDPIVRDVGHMGVSDRLEDAYRFRTPSLRNVALTAPYGHNGAYATLEGILHHHLDPAAGFANWSPDDVQLPEVPWLQKADFIPLLDRHERARQAAAGDLEPVSLSDGEVDQIIAFLQALTGTESIKGRLGRPESVPSGLEVD